MYYVVCATIQNIISKGAIDVGSVYRVANQLWIPKDLCIIEKNRP